MVFKAIRKGFKQLRKRSSDDCLEEPCRSRSFIDLCSLDVPYTSDIDTTCRSLDGLTLTAKLVPGLFQSESSATDVNDENNTMETLSGSSPCSCDDIDGSGDKYIQTFDDDILDKDDRIYSYDDDILSQDTRETISKMEPLRVDPPNCDKISDGEAKEKPMSAERRNLLEASGNLQVAKRRHSSKGCLKKWEEELAEEDERERKAAMKRSVSFNAIEILEFPMELGDNPSARGPPVQIGWECQNVDTFELDSYEKNKPNSRSKSEMLLPLEVRQKIVEDSGTSRSEARMAMNEAKKIRMRRVSSVENIKWDKLNYEKEKLGRKLKKVTSSLARFPSKSPDDPGTRSSPIQKLKRVVSLSFFSTPAKASPPQGLKKVASLSQFKADPSGSRAQAKSNVIPTVQTYPAEKSTFRPAHFCAPTTLSQGQIDAWTEIRTSQDQLEDTYDTPLMF